MAGTFGGGGGTYGGGRGVVSRSSSVRRSSGTRRPAAPRRPLKKKASSGFTGKPSTTISKPSVTRGEGIKGRPSTKIVSPIRKSATKSRSSKLARGGTKAKVSARKTKAGKIARPKTKVVGRKRPSRRKSLGKVSSLAQLGAAQGAAVSALKARGGKAAGTRSQGGMTSFKKPVKGKGASKARKSMRKGKRSSGSTLTLGGNFRQFIGKKGRAFGQDVRDAAARARGENIPSKPTIPSFIPSASPGEGQTGSPTGRRGPSRPGPSYTGGKLTWSFR